MTSDIKIPKKKPFNKRDRQFNNPFLKDVNGMIWAENRCCIIIIVGNTGLGKSYLGCKIASKLDPTFNADSIESRLVNKPMKMIELINEEKLKKGNVIMFDEAGTGISNQEWYSFNNKAINYILQTFRFRNLVVIFTVPYLNYIDSKARKLCDFVIECKKVDVRHKKNIVKIFKLQYNKITGDMYRKYPYYKIDGRLVQMRKFSFKKADDKLLKKYEELSRKFKKEIGYDLERDSQKIYNKENKKKVDVVDYIIKIKEDPEPFIKRFSTRTILSTHKIRAKYPELSGTQIGVIKAKLEKDLK